VKYAFIAEQLCAYPVALACEALGVSEAGYHAWKTRPEAPRTIATRALIGLIKRIFLASGTTYGAPRVYATLKAEHGYTGSLNRIKRLMRVEGLRAKAKRRYKATTDSKHDLPVAENRVAQRFEAQQPNALWLSDITYLRTQEGWLYLCCVLDLFTREIVGWAMKPSMHADIVTDALAMAKLRKRPGSGVIFHSDRGSQYVSHAVREWLEKERFIQSMSGTGNCYDNAPMESFWHTLKVERTHGQGYETRDQAKRDVFDYIEGWYNGDRIHSSLGYRSPREFEKQWRNQQLSLQQKTGTHNSSTKA
jgi:transposase InsO family protein